MASLRQIVIITLVSQLYVNAAPSDTKKAEHIAEPKLDNLETLSDVKDGSVGIEQGQRQKRFFNLYGYPPLNAPIYPSQPKRDDFQQTGVYGDDPLVHIYKRLQAISNIVKSPNYNFNIPLPPPQPIHYPLLLPVIYIPQIGCGCNDQKPQSPNNTDIGIENRFPEMEDDRQNWGFVINETETDDGKDEDFTRPISFVPIRPPSSAKPAPPVEHGSSQAGSNTNSISMTTTTSKPGSANPSPVDAPSTCDGAVLSCCHQSQVTYDCFAVQGCPDPTAYGNPCDPQVILRVIDRFQKFYGQRT